MNRIGEIINLYNKYGNCDYIGEKVSQIEHAIQAANYAEILIDLGNKAKHLYNIVQDVSITDIQIDEETKNSIIVASLLHDIGHLLYFEDRTISLMGELGVMQHETLGSIYLKKARFNKLVTYLVGSHVKAKRYLVTKFPKYKNKLSKASLQTLKHQGGDLSDEEIQKFENEKWFKYALIVRLADDYAKIEHSKLKGIENYKEMMELCINSL